MITLEPIQKPYIKTMKIFTTENTEGTEVNYMILPNLFLCLLW
jgi:hypothetical protein